MKIFITLAIVILFSVQSSAKSVSVYVAGSMKETFEVIKNEYQKVNAGIDLKVTYGSSGKGFFQIKNGAEYDIFISADEKYPEEIYLNKLAFRKSEVYAKGSMAVLFKDKGFKSISDLERLKIVAIANPKLAPYGKAAMEIMNNLSMINKIKDKIVVGENLIQVIQYIETGNADAGFVAYPLIVNSKLFEGRFIRVDASLFSPIKQSMVLTIFGENSKDAIKFYEFLRSAEVGNILKKYGFEVD